jgi:hypothetical protein
VFTENQGVKIADKSVRVFQGAEGYTQFLEFIYEQMRDGGLTYHLNFPDVALKNFGKEQGKAYVQKMSSIANLQAKCLVPEGDMNFPTHYAEYRWLPKTVTQTMPYFMFGDHVSLLSALSKDDVIFIAIYSPLLAETLRKQFEDYWDHAISIPEKHIKSYNG